MAGGRYAGQRDAPAGNSTAASSASGTAGISMNGGSGGSDPIRAGGGWDGSWTG